MKQNFSKEFTNSADYIADLSHQHYGFNIEQQRPGNGGMHRSRVHVIGDLTMTYSDIGPSTGIFENRNNQHKIIAFRFIKSGVEQHQYRGKKIKLCSNHCLIFELGRWSVFRRETRGKGINFFVPVTLVNEHFLQHLPSQLLLQCEHGFGKIIHEHTFTMEKELLSESANVREQLFKNYLDMIYYWLGQKTTASARVHKPDLAAIQHFIAKNLTNPDLCLPEIARHFSISTRTIQKLFESAKCSFSQFLNELRLERAAEDLLTSSLNITDLAYKWGFCDTSYFCRKFKEKYHMTPTDFYQTWQKALCRISSNPLVCPVKTSIVSPSKSANSQLI